MFLSFYQSLPISAASLLITIKHKPCQNFISGRNILFYSSKSIQYEGLLEWDFNTGWHMRMYHYYPIAGLKWRIFFSVVVNRRYVYFYFFIKGSPKT